MNCQHAIHLLDAYLDGELSPSLATEVDAHCVRCVECGRALALSQVASSVIAIDQGAPGLSADFTDRLLACVRPARPRRRLRRRLMWIGTPFAAAAVVVFAFVEYNARPAGKVLGKVEYGVVRPGETAGADGAIGLATGGDGSSASMERDWRVFIDRIEHDWHVRVDSGALLKRTFGQTVMDVMKSLSPPAADADAQCPEPADGADQSPSMSHPQGDVEDM